MVGGRHVFEQAFFASQVSLGSSQRRIDFVDVENAFGCKGILNRCDRQDWALKLEIRDVLWQVTSWCRRPLTPHLLNVWRSCRGSCNYPLSVLVGVHGMLLRPIFESTPRVTSSSTVLQRANTFGTSAQLRLALNRAMYGPFQKAAETAPLELEALHFFRLSRLR